MLFISIWTKCLVSNLVCYMEFYTQIKQIERILTVRGGKIPFPGSLLVAAVALSAFCYFFHLKHESVNADNQVVLVHLTSRFAARLHRRRGCPQTETAQTPFLRWRRRQGLPAHTLRSPPPPRALAQRILPRQRRALR